MPILNGAENNAVARTTVIFCVLAALCEGIDLQAAGVAASGIAAKFNASPAQLGNFFGASTFGLFSLLTPLAFDMASLSAARLLTGLGLGGALPILIALTAESSPENRRSANVTLMYSGAPFCGALASWVSMVFASSQWRWIFVVGGIAPLVLAPVMALLMPESPAFRRAQD